MGASIRQRLLNLSRERQNDFQSVLLRYAQERLLFRLGQSECRERFVLKGALSFSLWFDEIHRATRDLDLLAWGDNSVDEMERAFQSICRVPVEDDGLEFLADTVRGQRIKEDDDYEGVRVILKARICGATIPMQIDVGFGDAITPGPQEVVFPTLLPLRPPYLWIYPRETVVAEKFQAMVALGMANSRMKDFYDLWALSQNHPFDGDLLCQAIEATFARRKTNIPTEIPLALSDEFHQDFTKQTQWKAFIRKSKLSAGEPHFQAIAEALQIFLIPPMRSLAGGKAFEARWTPPGPWAPKP